MRGWAFNRGKGSVQSVVVLGSWCGIRTSWHSKSGFNLFSPFVCMFIVFVVMKPECEMSHAAGYWSDCIGFLRFVYDRSFMFVVEWHHCTWTSDVIRWKGLCLKGITRGAAMILRFGACFLCGCTRGSGWAGGEGGTVRLGECLTGLQVSCDIIRCIVDMAYIHVHIIIMSLYSNSCIPRHLSLLYISFASSPVIQSFDLGLTSTAAHHGYPGGAFSSMVSLNSAFLFCRKLSMPSLASLLLTSE